MGDDSIAADTPLMDAGWFGSGLLGVSSGEVGFFFRSMLRWLCFVLTGGCLAQQNAEQTC